MILVKGKHEAIISEEVFDKVHEKLASKSFKPGRPIGGDFYLRGLIKCPECGNNMVCRRTYYKTKKSKRTDNQALLHLFLIQSFREFCMSQ